MLQPETLSALLEHRAASQPDRVGYRLFAADPGQGKSLTYAALDIRARAVARVLVEGGMAGERVILLLPNSLDFVVGFFGVLYARGAAVPVIPSRSSLALPSMAAIFDDVDARAVLTTEALHSRLLASRGLERHLVRQQVILVDDIGDGTSSDGALQADPDGLAVVQYTSGSTNLPKGVKISHGNLLHNAALMASASGLSGESIGINWLPLFHDMGLMGGVIQPLYSGIPITLLSPATFLAQPAAWLQAITQQRATVTGAPNFAYELCVEKVSEEQIAALDLSTWDVAYSGAENVRSETIDRFSARFAPAGFSRNAFFPCYGLAEATLIVSGGPKGRSPRILDVDRIDLEKSRRASAPRGTARRLVSSGRPMHGQTVLIVDPDTREVCPELHVGEIWVSGPSIGTGYWRRGSDTSDVFGAALANCDDGRYLRTGDLGFLHDQDLFIVDRIKDLIIIRGFNYYPHDIELTVQESHDAFRTSTGVAFAIDVEGDERLVVLQEVSRDRAVDASSNIGAIRSAIAAQHGLAVHAVVILRQGSLPKTTSGKVQRHLARAAFDEGTLKHIFEWRGVATSGSHYVAPVSPAEDLVASIWRTELNLEKVGTADNFFDLGGQSPSLVRVHAKLEAALGRTIPSTILFQYTTVAALARYLEDSVGQGPVFDHSRQRVQSRQKWLGAARSRTRLRRDPNGRDAS